MASPPNYALGRDLLASLRLNLQHFLWHKVFPALLHARITPAPDTPLAVADVGCGTGVWLLELSEQVHPDSRLVGYDVSMAQIPCSAAFLPPNVSFAPLDILRAPPPALHAQFDVVHLRLFTCVLGAAPPDAVLAHAMCLLKPGGWVQWAELDRASQTLVKGRPGLSARMCEMVQERGRGEGGLAVGTWVEELEEWFGRAGLVEVEVERRRTPERWLGVSQTNMLAVYQELMGALPEGEYLDKVKALQRGVADEIGSGVAFDQVRVVCIGRKPL